VFESGDDSIFAAGFTFTNEMMIDSMFTIAYI